MPQRVLCIGECMIEVAAHGEGQAKLGFGGDTLNTAVYLARLGITVDYATALGTDGSSDAMVEAWATEGVGTSLVARCGGRLPGLYLIHTDANGERTFSYWRDRAPARDLFQLPEAAPAVAAIATCDVAYFSGITLSILGESGRAAFHDRLSAARARNAWVVFDGNYRPRGWSGKGEAQQAFKRFMPLVTHALPTFDDEMELFGDTDPTETIARLRGYGVSEIVVKHGAAGVTIASDGTTLHVPVPQPLQAVDTTAAGDSFNAGYLAARIAGADVVAAAEQGHRVAAIVIGHRGAIVPKAAMAALRPIAASERVQPDKANGRAF